MVAALVHRANGGYATADAKPWPVILSLGWYGVYSPIQEMMLDRGPE